MDDSGGADRGGRWARAFAVALGPEPQPQRKAIVSAAAPAAVLVVKKQGSYLEEDGGSGGIRSASPRLTLQLRGGSFYIRAGTVHVLRLGLRVRTGRAREAVVPEDPLTHALQNSTIRPAKSSSND